MNKLFSLAAIVFPFLLSAQDFKWEARSEPSPEDGYIKILLKPEISSQLREGFPDLRIYDTQDRETPYLLYADEARQGNNRFVAYQVIASNYARGCCSFITVKNPTGRPIDHIVLEVNNTEARREMRLAGSYDGISWFAVRDAFRVESFNGWIKGEKKTTTLIRFDFPLTDYTFYKFEFDDWRYWWHDGHYPVYLVRAGYVEPTFISEKCMELPSPVFVQKDNARETTVKFSFTNPQYADHIKFQLKHEKNNDYYRSAVLYALKKGPDKKTTEQYIATTILSSVNENEIDLPEGRFKDFVLKINNEDDRPLIVEKIVAWQVKHYLVIKAEKDQAYTVRFGNDSLSAPVYDLQYFKSKIPDSMKVISTMGPLKISQAAPSQKENPKAKNTFFTNKNIIWIAVIFVALLLLLLTARMLNDMKNRNQ